MPPFANHLTVWRCCHTLHRMRDTSQIVAVLKQCRPELAQRFGVRSLSLFGSAARQEATASSDVDLLVAFSHPPGFDGYMALKWYLEELLVARVDLVMEGALRGEARAIVESESVRVA